jgi:response regulator RpfG family c-di-GMP phosphodiesterase
MADSNTTFQFIIIDDNDIDQLLHRKLIELIVADATFHQYTDAEKALEAISNQTFSTNNFDQNIILLDIKMPLMDGFEFLEAFHHIDENIKNVFTIYIVTSSLNQFDISRSKSNPYVKDMIIKPVNIESLKTILLS